ncbi:unnamed protein product [Polarella glacialis]|uniref:Uncharacterized protein n=1 Tax=Polarella glacialis TaxID=89957 RepID=A0A813LAN2_POLGL|nr:unnamed protein product [Polarella glacialis]
MSISPNDAPALARVCGIAGPPRTDLADGSRYLGPLGYCASPSADVKARQVLSGSTVGSRVMCAASSPSSMTGYVSISPTAGFIAPAIADVRTMPMQEHISRLAHVFADASPGNTPMHSAQSPQFHAASPAQSPQSSSFQCGPQIFQPCPFPSPGTNEASPYIQVGARGFQQPVWRVQRKPVMNPFGMTP